MATYQDAGATTGGLLALEEATPGHAVNVRRRRGPWWDTSGVTPAAAQAKDDHA